MDDGQEIIKLIEEIKLGKPFKVLSVKVLQLKYVLIGR